MATATETREDLQEPTPAFSPLYQQIKALITRSLQSGEWRPGEAIPSEMELAARYRVSQGTVRKAIDELAVENRVVRRQGKGTFVATHSAIPSLSQLGIRCGDIQRWLKPWLVSWTSMWAKAGASGPRWQAMITRPSLR